MWQNSRDKLHELSARFGALNFSSLGWAKANSHEMCILTVREERWKALLWPSRPKNDFAPLRTSGERCFVAASQPCYCNWQSFFVIIASVYYLYCWLTMRFFVCAPDADAGKAHSKMPKYAPFPLYPDNGKWFSLHSLRCAHKPTMFLLFWIFCSHYLLCDSEHTQKNLVHLLRV